MQNKPKTKGGWRSAARVSTLSGMLLAGAMSMAPGCLDRPLEPVEPRTTTTIIERLTQSSVDKIDLLLMIDNSRSMADKQEILQLAVPDLVNQLINPRCLDPDGMAANPQPGSPLDDCPDGFEREFEPVTDIHIGVITSSLGGHGADACDGTSNVSENDKGQLIFRSDTQGGPAVGTYQGLGYLVWDPDTANPAHSPQGETDATTLAQNVQAMVAGAGEVGCGYEANLESWYRFLVEPDPHDTITVTDNKAVLEGTDTVLLEQRKNFMRPDSLLAVIMLTDENDCSIRDGSQFYFAAQIYTPGTSNPYHLPKPRAACATDPNGDCCRSCGQPAGAGCDESQDDCSSGPLSQLDDQINLRCFDQKRRFGIDFLQPMTRYVEGLTLAKISDRHGELVPNPIFSDLDPSDSNSNIRDPGLVFVAGIVGVPWQDIARRNENGDPDLLFGQDTAGDSVGGFMSSDELAQNGVWDVILGDPDNYIPPTDPLMIESVAPRTGTNPVTGDAAQPTDAAEGANPINGHEYTIAQKNDLQYSCIFPLSMNRDCSDPTQTACDCLDVNNDNPLCDPSNRQIQKYAKAYPGTRQLQLLRLIGTQGIVGSICPAQQDNPNNFDFGYRPAIGAIVDRLKLALGGQCLPRTLTPNAEGQVSCFILEAKIADSCNCDVPGRQPVGAENQAAVDGAQKDPVNPGWNCFCEITQASGEELTACQDVNSDTVQVNGADVHGWCYVDSTTVPPTGNPDIVASCPANEKRIIKFVGDGKGSAGATLFINCSGE